MSERSVPFEPLAYYHLYNHSNGWENLFILEDNYRYFLEKYFYYFQPVARTYVYCLMPNHFHFLLQIKSEKELLQFYIEKHRINQNENGILENLDCSKIISQQLSNFLNCYTQAFNKQHQRKGSLMRHSTKRKLVHNEGYFTRLVQYIHANPVKHGFVAELEDWPHSSIHYFRNKKPTKLARMSVFDWFGSEEAFWRFHRL